jgi:hypothetical protein
MEPSKASRVAGGLLAISGVLGVIILALDQVLRGVPLHMYSLVVFVIIDFILAGYVLAKPSRMPFTLAAAWSLIRVVLQVADVSQAHLFQFRYREFADYLFNPFSSWPATLGNPPGVPATLIDLIVLSEIIVVAVAWGARSVRKS